MKYPITLLVTAAVMLLVGIGVRMHANWRYTNKMYYHTVASGLYEFDDVFAEYKLGDTVQLLSMVAGIAGGCWFAVVKINGNRKRL